MQFGEWLVETKAVDDGKRNHTLKQVQKLVAGSWDSLIALYAPLLASSAGVQRNGLSWLQDDSPAWRSQLLAQLPEVRLLLIDSFQVPPSDHIKATRLMLLLVCHQEPLTSHILKFCRGY